VVIDIGTGSGSAVLRRAAREAETLFIAIDADARAMADVSRRAARPPRRGGRANVIFLAAAAESLPDVLCHVAHEATVALPWGSLLQAAVDPASAGFAGIAECLAATGELTILVSATGRDGLAGLGELNASAADALAQRYCSAGLEVAEFRQATRDDIELLSSGWGRRLGIPERRQAWLYKLRVR
jgi:16S rRNA (adenine(1408)-N(1))-methyltransferase